MCQHLFVVSVIVCIVYCSISVFVIHQCFCFNYMYRVFKLFRFIQCLIILMLHVNLSK